MVYLIKTNSTDMYFGILTVMEYPNKGYKAEGVLTYLGINENGFVDDMVDDDSEGFQRVRKLIAEEAKKKCNEFSINLMRY